MSIPAAVDNINIEQGAKFTRLYVYLDSNGSPVDLTGYTAALKIKRFFGGTAITSLTHSSGLTLGTINGTILVTLNATVTAAYTFSRAKYDLELYPAGVAANAVRLVQGSVTLFKEITV